MSEWLLAWLIDWLIDERVSDWLIDWLIDWLLFFSDWCGNITGLLKRWPSSIRTGIPPSFSSKLDESWSRPFSTLHSRNFFPCWWDRGRWINTGCVFWTTITIRTTPWPPVETWTMRWRFLRWNSGINSWTIVWCISRRTEHAQLRCYRKKCIEFLRYSTNYPINQSINRAISQSINRSIGQSINQSINRAINQSIDRAIYQSINQSTGPSVNQSIDELMNRSLILTQKKVLIHVKFLIFENSQRDSMPIFGEWLNSPHSKKERGLRPSWRKIGCEARLTPPA